MPAARKLSASRCWLICQVTVWGLDWVQTLVSVLKKPPCPEIPVPVEQIVVREVPTPVDFVKVIQVPVPVDEVVEKEIPYPVEKIVERFRDVVREVQVHTIAYRHWHPPTRKVSCPKKIILLGSCLLVVPQSENGESDQKDSFD